MIIYGDIEMSRLTKVCCCFFLIYYIRSALKTNIVVGIETVWCYPLKSIVIILTAT